MVDILFVHENVPFGTYAVQVWHRAWICWCIDDSRCYLLGMEEMTSARSAAKGRAATSEGGILRYLGVVIYRRPGIHFGPEGPFGSEILSTFIY